MSWLPSLVTWQFAVAGLVGGAATVLIHVFNRRRYRVIEWGAMEFLRQANQRNRRVIQVRDTLLLTLRTLAVLLFGLALARPHFATSQSATGSQPLFALLVVDNSLSMTYRTFEGTLLQQAKQAARDVLERLPQGSQIGIIATCDDEATWSIEPLTNIEDAVSAIERIEAVDRAASVAQVMKFVRDASEQIRELPAELFLFTDQQRETWRDAAEVFELPRLDAMHVIDLAPTQRDNTWVADIQLPDEFAEGGSPTTINAIIQRQGGNVDRQVEVSLLVNEQVVETKTIPLAAAPAVVQAVTFQHRFEPTSRTMSDINFVPIRVALTPDRLPLDDSRYALVPVLPALPIVYVDQWSAEEEDPARQRWGETRSLRKLFRPEPEEDLRAEPRVARHVKFASLQASDLDDARLVILAGVSEPGPSVPLLREFVERGGRLLIAAGGNFSPRRWQEQAWLDGAGILPAPLLPDLLGQLPERSEGELQPLLLSYECFANSPDFQLPGSSEETLREVYAEPVFFQAVAIDESQGNQPGLVVWARFTSEHGPAYLVERKIGRGRVAFASSGLTSNWNTLPHTNAIVLFDRIVRRLIRSTWHEPHLATQAEITVELPLMYRDASVMLRRPGDTSLTRLESTFLDREHVGVRIPQAWQRGIYQVRVVSADSTTSVAEATSTGATLWSRDLALHGDSRESDLSKIDEATVAEWARHIPLNVTSSSADIRLWGTRSLARNLWWWLAVVVLLLLVVEAMILATAPGQRSIGLRGLGA